MEFSYNFICGVTLMFCVAAQASPFTKDTAPDTISRDILSHRITRVDQGAPSGVDPSPTIHRNFPQIIEQNFARLDVREMADLVDALSDAELSDLAQLYVNATTDHGLPPKLLFVMAHRLDPRHLGRVSSHFGFAPVYEAVTAVAPAKTQDFLVSSYTSYQGPTPGEMRFGPAGRFAPIGSSYQGPLTVKTRFLLDDRFAPPRNQSITFADYRLPSASTRGGMHKVGGYGQFLNMTPYEIYLDFRTAPVGALGVTGALWETSVVLSTRLGGAYYTGYEIGTYVVAPLVQNYAPNLYNAIGSSIANIVDTLTTSWAGGVSAAGQAQQSTAPLFQCTNSQMTDFSSFGGDYGAADDWSTISGGGGGSSPPPYPVHAR